MQRVGLAAELGFTSAAVNQQAFVAPRTHLEKVLAKIWAAVLDVERVGIYDNFFALGGDSLLATHVLAQVYDIVQSDVEVSLIFEAPTVAEMAHHLERLTLTGHAQRRSSAIVRVPREGTAPASIAQERLWKLQQALPGLPFFNVLYALRLTSPVDVAFWSGASMKSCDATKSCVRPSRRRWSARADCCAAVDRPPAV